jgi:hypothetical protein
VTASDIRLGDCPLADTAPQASYIRGWRLPPSPFVYAGVPEEGESPDNDEGGRRGGVHPAKIPKSISDSGKHRTKSTRSIRYPARSPLRRTVSRHATGNDAVRKHANKFLARMVLRCLRPRCCASRLASSARLPETTGSSECGSACVLAA